MPVDGFEQRVHQWPEMHHLPVAASNQGSPLTVTLVFASGTTAYGPITETWSASGAQTVNRKPSSSGSAPRSR